MLTVMLHNRFGDHPQIPAIVQHLNQDSDDLARVRTIDNAKTIDDLLSQLPPTR